MKKRKKMWIVLSSAVLIFVSLSVYTYFKLFSEHWYYNERISYQQSFQLDKSPALIYNVKAVTKMWTRDRTWRDWAAAPWYAISTKFYMEKNHIPVSSVEFTYPIKLLGPPSFSIDQIVQSKDATRFFYNYYANNVFERQVLTLDNKENLTYEHSKLLLEPNMYNAPDKIVIEAIALEYENKSAFLVTNEGLIKLWIKVSTGDFKGIELNDLILKKMNIVLEKNEAFSIDVIKSPEYTPINQFITFSASVYPGEYLDATSKYEILFDWYNQKIVETKKKK